jgi:predicted dehydrogenase
MYEPDFSTDSLHTVQTAALRIGVLGAAHIAGQFVDAVRESSLVKVVAVASRDVAKAHQFGEKHQVATRHGSYEALMADPAVECVYIPLPNALHCEWAIKAAKMGKHVLCEKPLALNRDQAEQMFAAARANGVMLLEAFPYYFQPQTGVMMDLLRAGAIGQVRSVQASFGFPLPPPGVGSSAAPGGNIRLKPELGGGALLDAGSYPLSLIRLVMGCKPVRVMAHAQWDADSGVDIAMMATLDYGDGRMAQMSCSMNVANHRHATIMGTAGTLETEYLNHAGLPLSSQLRIRRGVANSLPFETVVAPAGQVPSSGFRFCAEAFALKIRAKDDQAMTVAEIHSLDNALVLAALAQSARSQNFVTL